MGGLNYPEISVLAFIARQSYDALLLLQIPDSSMTILWLFLFVVSILLISLTAPILWRARGAKLKERKTFIDNIDGISVEEILAGRYEEIGIGGGIVLAQTEIPLTKWTSVFAPVVDENSLVNLVLRGEIQLERIILDTNKRETTDQELVVLVIINNKTREEMKFNISKGQVFENRFPENFGQNLVAAVDHKKILILPNEKKNIRVPAYCLNENLPPPFDNKGNLTILELRNKNFVNQAQLWKIIKRAKKQLNVEDDI